MMNDFGHAHLQHAKVENQSEAMRERDAINVLMRARCSKTGVPLLAWQQQWSCRT